MPPVPSPTPLVVKNGSTILSRLPLAIPIPVFSTVIETFDGGGCFCLFIFLFVQIRWNQLIDTGDYPDRHYVINAAGYYRHNARNKDLSAVCEEGDFSVN